MRLSRRIYAKNGWKLEFTAESFNLLNRLNRRFTLTDDGAMSNAAQFNYGTKRIGIRYFPAYYQVPTKLYAGNERLRPPAVAVFAAIGILSGVSEGKSSPQIST